MKIKTLIFLIMASALLINPICSMDYNDQEDQFSLEDLIKNLQSFGFRPSFDLYKDCLDKDVLRLNRIILSKIRVDIQSYYGSLDAKKLIDPSKTSHLKLSIKYNINRDTLLSILNDIVLEYEIPGEHPSSSER